jgi:hypothetical protein
MAVKVGDQSEEQMTKAAAKIDNILHTV